MYLSALQNFSTNASMYQCMFVSKTEIIALWLRELSRFISNLCLVSCVTVETK